MKSFEQVLVKSAAVIGICCSRQMLKAIVPGFGEKKFRQAIYQLMLSHVFECASKIVADKVEVPKKQTVKLCCLLLFIFLIKQCCFNRTM